MSSIEQEVERTLKLLVRLIRIVGLTRAQVDAKAGQGRGFSTRILNGIVGLKHEHTLTLLRCIGIEPGDFFRLLYARPEDRTNGGTVSRLLAEIEIPDITSEEAPAPPSTSLRDPEDVVRRITALVRAELGIPSIQE